MSQFQAQAALLRQMQLERGGKNQVRSTDTTPQIVQPTMAQAPAVGALAPLVMPVPDYQSANTLEQAINAVNSFGNVIAQAGNFARQTKQEVKQQSYVNANNQFRLWKEQRIRDQNSSDYNARMTPIGANTTQWIDAVIGNEDNIEDPDAAANLRLDKLQYASNEIAPFHQKWNNKMGSEMLGGYAARMLNNDPSLTMDEMETNAAQYGITKEELTTKLVKDTAETMGARGGNPKDLEYILARLDPESQKVYGDQVEMAFKKGRTNTINNINLNDTRAMQAAIEAPNINEAIKILNEQTSKPEMAKEMYALDVLKSNPRNMENIINLETYIKTPIAKQQYETLRNSAGIAYEENVGEWIRQQLRSGAATPEETTAIIKERASRWVFGVEGSDPLSPGRQILGSLSPGTVKQLEGEMGTLIKSRDNLNALNEHIKSNFTSEMTPDVKKGATEQHLLDGSPTAIKFALENGTVIQGGINDIYTNLLDEKGNVKDPELLLQISQLKIQFAGIEGEQTRRFWREIADIANSPIKYSAESKEILIKQAQKNYQLNKADTTTIEEQDFADAKKTIEEVQGIDNKTSNDIRSKAWANGESHHDGGSFWWSADDTYESMRETRTLTGSDVKQINGDFAKIYLKSTDQSVLGLTKAWNKAMENAKTRYQPIKINGKVVGRVDQTNEPAWNPTAESQLNEDFGDGKIANISYQGIAEDSHIYIVTTKDFQSHYWKEDTQRAEKTRQDQILKKEQETKDKFLKNKQKIIDMEDRPTYGL
ncbi:hypothetical protein UFOVP997_19 [uncultured Caudovirales phage]|uniref:Uncharacterized protein n=3 Tax=uncultured Caudovirales phage TaxID=2100421 RepID=A0A6J5Q737_9CAUD|nr:hypothetical protein UFOVP911_33 [uncultured Caudovirales phage]CAB4177298.1 hypothetical protein UFOVP997_19 [uncultured Caudovirales phage]CAB4183288.1 hypothetical protein UFOVP1088_50 [uncultured Caudovirales phage]CAB4186411.1 hypothetical protein UFOVP1149_13 [uncultured Caudovirales phage]CAB4199495.1 hypothetical protein UFOVP1330_51 [uncultured Caudovirales phage]